MGFLRNLISWLRNRGDGTAEPVSAAENTGTAKTSATARKIKYIPPAVAEIRSLEQELDRAERQFAKTRNRYYRSRSHRKSSKQLKRLVAEAIEIRRICARLGLKMLEAKGRYGKKW